MQSLFSLDLKGEEFSEPEASDPSDDQSNDEEESAINVKDSSDSRVNVADEETKLIKISLASHVRDLNNIPYKGNTKLYEVYWHLTMDIRKFIYNSLVSEDFCLNCRVFKDSGSYLVHTGVPKPPPTTKSNKGGLDIDNLYSSSLVDFKPSINPVSQKTSMSVDGFNDLMSFDLNEGIEKLTNSSLDGISSISSLESISLNASESESEDDQFKDDPKENVDEPKDYVDQFDSICEGSESILLELSPSKLNRTVMEMAHVLMRRFHASYPRSFRAATGNIAADVYALGKRYYISNDQVTEEFAIDELDKSHIVFLSHLYRRQRNICYYCGFARCERSKSSKNSCQFQKCIRCLGYHRWSFKTCKKQNNTLDRYLQSNDWRTRRPNYWASQPPAVKELLHCFYCNNEGEANFKCQGLSCPEGAETLWIRCLELMGTKKLKQERNTNPHLFPHFAHRGFVFNEKFQIINRK